MHLVKFYFDCGRMGDLSGAFIVNAEGLRRLKVLIDSGQDVSFGEVLGKHSDIYGPIEPRDVEVIELTDATAVAVMTAFGEPVNAAGWATLSGYNPLDYADLEDDGDEHDDDINEVVGDDPSDPRPSSDPYIP